MLLEQQQGLHLETIVEDTIQAFHHLIDPACPLVHHDALNVVFGQTEE
jgi:hypothetical protein